MNTEQLHDALNHLDDNMIEEVAGLRNRKKPKVWLKVGSMAACVLLLIGAYAVGKQFLPSTNNAPNLDEESFDAGCLTESSGAANGNIQSSTLTDGDLFEDPTEGINGSPVAPEEAPDASVQDQLANGKIRVQVKQWEADYMIGTVSGSNDDGKPVRVQLPEGQPPFPEGSTVVVYYSLSETSENMIVLYAYTVEALKP